MDFSTTPSLVDVQLAFEHWRSQRTSRITPDRLRAMALSLIANHKRSTICAALGINNQALKSWSNSETDCLPAVDEDAKFVSLPASTLEPVTAPTKSIPGSDAGATELAIELPNGIQLHIRHSLSITQLLESVCQLGSAR